MRTQFIICAIVLMTITGSLLHANILPLSDEQCCEDVINDIVLPFLDALRNGDVDSIKLCIAGDIYENKKVLLEKNKGYPEFLRNYYQGVDFYIESAQQSGDFIVVDIVIEFINGDEGNARLYLGQDLNNPPGAAEAAAWKIVGFHFK